MASSGEVEDRSSERSKVNCCCGPQPDKKPRRSCPSCVAQRRASQRAARRQQATSVPVQPLGRVLRCARSVSDVLGVSQMCSEVLLAWVSQMCSDPICAGSEQAQTQISLRLRKHRGGACVIAHPGAVLAMPEQGRRATKEQMRNKCIWDGEPGPPG